MSTDATTAANSEGAAGSDGATAPSTAAELLRLKVPDLKALLTRLAGTTTFGQCRKAALQETLAAHLGFEPLGAEDDSAPRAARARDDGPAARRTRTAGRGPANEAERDNECLTASSDSDRSEDEGRKRRGKRAANATRRDNARTARERDARERAAAADAEDDELDAAGRVREQILRDRLLAARVQAAGGGGASSGSSDSESSSSDDGSMVGSTRMHERQQHRLDAPRLRDLHARLAEIEEAAKQARADFGELKFTPASHKKYRTFEFKCYSELTAVGDKALLEARVLRNVEERADLLARALTELTEGLLLMQHGLVIHVEDGWDAMMKYVSSKEVLAKAVQPKSRLLPGDYAPKKGKRAKKKRKRKARADDTSDSGSDSDTRTVRKKPKKVGFQAPLAKVSPRRTAAGKAKKKKKGSPKKTGKKSGSPTSATKAKKGKLKGVLRNAKGARVVCWAKIGKKQKVCGGNHYENNCPHADHAESSSSSDEDSDSSE